MSIARGKPWRLLIRPLISSRRVANWFSVGCVSLRSKCRVVHPQASASIVARWFRRCSHSRRISSSSLSVAKRMPMHVLARTPARRASGRKKISCRARAGVESATKAVVVIKVLTHFRPCLSYSGRCLSALRSKRLHIVARSPLPISYGPNPLMSRRDDLDSSHAESMC